MKKNSSFLFNVQEMYDITVQNLPKEPKETRVRRRRISTNNAVPVASSDKRHFIANETRHNILKKAHKEFMKSEIHFKILHEESLKRTVQPVEIKIGMTVKVHFFDAVKTVTLVCQQDVEAYKPLIIEIL